MATTIDPVVSEDGKYLGSEIHQRSEGAWRSIDQGIVQLPDGRYDHAFKDVELDEGYDGGYNEDSYVNDLLELYGGREGFNQRVAWAQANLPEVTLQHFNDLLNKDRTAEALHWLDEQYRGSSLDHNGSQQQVDDQAIEEEGEQPTDDDIESWYENNVSEEEFVAEYEHLNSATYTPEQVEAMVSLANQLPQDSVEFAVLSAGAAIANGTVQFADVFEQLAEHFGESHLVYAYKTLQQYFNNN